MAKITKNAPAAAASFNTGGRDRTLFTAVSAKGPRAPSAVAGAAFAVSARKKAASASSSLRIIAVAVGARSRPSGAGVLESLRPFNQSVSALAASCIEP
jgi:hypothetical protein